MRGAPREQTQVQVSSRFVQGWGNWSGLQVNLTTPQRTFADPCPGMLVVFWGAQSTLNDVENMLVIYQVIGTNVPNVGARNT